MRLIKLSRVALNTLITLALASTASLASANLIVNGSFESVNQPSGTWNIYSTLDGWQVGSNGVEIRNNVAGAAYDGANFVELDTRANSWISQTFATTAGQTYALSFFYSPRPGVSVTSNPIDVYLNNILTAGATADGTTNTVNAWKDYTQTFVATGAFTTLTFAAGGTSDSVGGSLDNVSVNATPEPATLSLLLVAAGALGFSTRRRAR